MIDSTLRFTRHRRILRRTGAWSGLRVGYALLNFNADEKGEPGRASENSPAKGLAVKASCAVAWRELGLAVRYESKPRVSAGVTPSQQRGWHTA